MSNTAIIKSNADSFEEFFLVNLRKEIKDKADVFGLYKNSTIQKALIKSSHVLSFPKESYVNSHLLGSFVTEVKNYDNVIVFDNGTSYYILDLIRKNNPNARLIFWNWNSGLDAQREKILKDKGYEIYCFDKKECENKKFKYNIQFFFSESSKTTKGKNHDFVFAGRDKGRFQTVDNIRKTITSLGYSSYLKVLTVNPKNLLKNSVYTMKNIKYTKILNEELKSKCIIDITKAGQEGLTLRVLEAMFFGRKLLTNNTGVKNFPFYNSNNILCFENELNPSDLKKFMQLPYCNIDQKYMEMYSVKKWFKNFEIN